MSCRYKTAGIILTVPHAKSGGTSGHNSDLFAAKAAELIFFRLKNIKFIKVIRIIIGDVNRDECDLNRKECDTLFDKELDEQINTFKRECEGMDIWIFDIHSYPKNSEREEDCYILFRTQQNYVTSLFFKEYLEKYSSGIKLKAYRGGNNYIINHYGDKINGRAILFEFKEDTNLAPCIDGIITSVENFFDPFQYKNFK
jgi:hypothetical protein